MIGIAAALLIAIVGPAQAQDQPGNVERVETPQGAVTIVRPTRRAQPATPAPQVNPDPLPPPPATPFLTDQDGRRPSAPAPPGTGYGAPYPYVAPYPYSSPYSPYVVVNPPIVVIPRRGVPAQATPPPRDVGPVPPFQAPPAGTLRSPSTQTGPQPGAPLQSRDGFGRQLPAPRYPSNQYGPGAVPGTVPLPDAADIIILRR